MAQLALAGIVQSKEVLFLNVQLQNGYRQMVFLDEYAFEYNTLLLIKDNMLYGKEARLVL